MKVNAPPGSFTRLQKVWRPEQGLATRSQTLIPKAWPGRAWDGGPCPQRAWTQWSPPLPPGLPRGTLACTPTHPQYSKDAAGVPAGLSKSQLSPVSNHTRPQEPSRTHTRSGNMRPVLFVQHQMTLQAGVQSSPTAHRQEKQGP